MKRSISCIWKKKYKIVEQMLIQKMAWSHAPKWAKKLIRKMIKEELK